MSAAPFPLDVEVVAESALWDALPEAEDLARAAVEAAFLAGGLAARPGAELTVLLADDARVRGLNRAWRGSDKPTNVLSFPAAEGGAAADAPHVGDVVLAQETVAREAAAEGKPLGHHLAHLVVHGTLHLFGFEHDTDRGAETMEEVERAALARLGIPDPHAETSTAAAV